MIAAYVTHDMPAMALLDRDGVYGAPRFYLAAKKVGIKAHIGAEITVKVQRPMSNVQCRRQDFGLWTLDFGQSVIRLPFLVGVGFGFQIISPLFILLNLPV